MFALGLSEEVGKSRIPSTGASESSSSSLSSSSEAGPASSPSSESSYLPRNAMSARVLLKSLGRLVVEMLPTTCDEVAELNNLPIVSQKSFTGASGSGRSCKKYMRFCADEM